MFEVWVIGEYRLGLHLGIYVHLFPLFLRCVKHFKPFKKSRFRGTFGAETHWRVAIDSTIVLLETRRVETQRAETHGTESSLGDHNKHILCT